jgi:pimeloyl-ACP methyl ester carboxylesterase
MTPAVAHETYAAPGASPSKWLLFLHGILGMRTNWRSFSRRLAAERPSWGAVLVDLRLHGGSRRGFEPPHTVARAALDLGALDALVPGPIAGVLGHSFGGKVALAYARQHPDLEQLFVIDATPGARPDARGSESTRHIVELLESLPETLPSKDAFMKLLAERGVTREIAMWLAMNVRPAPGERGGDGVRFDVDLPAIHALLDDYFLADLWAALEDPAGATRRHVIAGARSDVVDEADRERARRAPRTTLDVVEGAGHWVHVEQPDALLRVVASYL